MSGEEASQKEYIESEWPSSKKTQVTNVGEIGEKGPFVHCWWEQ